MSIALDLLILVLLLAKPSTVELSVVMRVEADSSLPISLSTVRIRTASWPLWNRAPISASEAAGITFLIILLSIRIGPLGLWISGIWGLILVAQEEISANSGSSFGLA
jgi:hypothetical protein